MNPILNLPIQELYKIHHRLPVVEHNGLKDYPVIKKYVELQKTSTNNSQQKIKHKKNIKLRTYLDEQEKRYKDIPGPGKYNIASDWKVTQCKIKNDSNRMTFLEEIVRRTKRNKSPGPGDHQQLTINHPQQILRSKPKRIKSSQRIFYYDENLYSASKSPGPGQYNVNLQPIVSFRRANQSPQKSIRKFRAQSEKKLKNTPKLPDIGSYNPEESNFFTFQAVNKVKPSKKSFGVGEKFKTEPIGSGLSPDKYGVINEWKGKQSRKKTYQKQGLDMLSRPQPRVYN